MPAEGLVTRFCMLTDALLRRLGLGGCCAMVVATSIRELALFDWGLVLHYSHRPAALLEC
jgi:hypothetical protein